MSTKRLNHIDILCFSIPAAISLVTSGWVIDSNTTFRSALKVACASLKIPDGHAVGVRVFLGCRECRSYKKYEESQELHFESQRHCDLSLIVSPFLMPVTKLFPEKMSMNLMIQLSLCLSLAFLLSILTALFTWFQVTRPSNSERLPLLDPEEERVSFNRN